MGWLWLGGGMRGDGFVLQRGFGFPLPVRWGEPLSIPAGETWKAQLPDGTILSGIGPLRGTMAVNIFDLHQGVVDAEITSTGRTFRIRLPWAVVEVLGTRLRLTVGTVLNRIEVLEGRVQVRDESGKATLLSAGAILDLPRPGMTPAAPSSLSPDAPQPDLSPPGEDIDQH